MLEEALWLARLKVPCPRGTFRLRAYNMVHGCTATSSGNLDHLPEPTMPPYTQLALRQTGDQPHRHRWRGWRRILRCRRRSCVRNASWQCRGDAKRRPVRKLRGKRASRRSWKPWGQPQNAKVKRRRLHQRVPTRPQHRRNLDKTVLLPRKPVHSRLPRAPIHRLSRQLPPTPRTSLTAKDPSPQAESTRDDQAARRQGSPTHGLHLRLNKSAFRLGAQLRLALRLLVTSGDRLTMIADWATAPLILTWAVCQSLKQQERAQHPSHHPVRSERRFRFHRSPRLVPLRVMLAK